jgi:hypothetical protein
VALRRRGHKPGPAVPEILSMFHRKGRSWSHSLEPGSLQRFLDDALATGGISAQVSWEQAGQLGTSLLLSQWPDFLPQPAAVFLRRHPRKPFALELSVDLDGDLEVQEYGEDLRRCLMGERRLEEVQSVVPVAQTEPPLAPQPQPPLAPQPQPPLAPQPQPPLAPQPQPPPQSQPVAKPAPQPPAAPISQSIPVTQPVLDPASEPAPVVEVIAPGERIFKTSGRTWSHSADDLFGLGGELHPDDQKDHGLEICSADLPWLNPGDSIISPRRGPCRIKRVEDEARQIVAKDENQQMIVITFRELLAEFQFDDGN